MLVDLQDVGARYHVRVDGGARRARVPQGRREGGDPRSTEPDRSHDRGRMQEPGFPFVALERIPIRHGLTLGEIVHWRGKLEGWEADIVVARSGKWPPAPWNKCRRRTCPPSTRRFRVSRRLPPRGDEPPTDAGRPAPSEITGAPWIDGERWVKELHATGPAGLRGAAAHVRADVSQARQAAVRRRADPRDLGGGLRPVATYGRSSRSRIARRRTNSGSGRRSTSTSTTSPRSISSPDRRRRVSASRRRRRSGDRGRVSGVDREARTRASSPWLKRTSGRCRVVRSTASMAREPLAFLTRISKQHGDIVRFRLLTHEVPSSTTRRDRGARRRAQGPPHQGLADPRALARAGQRLLLNQGALWKRQRKMIQPGFHRDRTAKYGDVMVRYTERSPRSGSTARSATTST